MDVICESSFLKKSSHSAIETTFETFLLKHVPAFSHYESQLREVRKRGLETEAAVGQIAPKVAKVQNLPVIVPVLAGRLNQVQRRQEKVSEQVDDLALQLSKRCLVMSGPDVPCQTEGETDLEATRIFLNEAWYTFSVDIKRVEYATCHRTGPHSIIMAFNNTARGDSSYDLLLTRSHQRQFVHKKIWVKHRKTEADKAIYQMCKVLKRANLIAQIGNKDNTSGKIHCNLDGGRKITFSMKSQIYKFAKGHPAVQEELRDRNMHLQVVCIITFGICGLSADLSTYFLSCALAAFHRVILFDHYIFTKSVHDEQHFMVLYFRSTNANIFIILYHSQ